MRRKSEVAFTSQAYPCMKKGNASLKPPGGISNGLGDTCSLTLLECRRMGSMSESPA